MSAFVIDRCDSRLKRRAVATVRRAPDRAIRSLDWHRSV